MKKRGFQELTDSLMYRIFLSLMVEIYFTPVYTCREKFWLGGTFLHVNHNNRFKSSCVAIMFMVRYEFNWKIYFEMIGMTK